MFSSAACKETHDNDNAQIKVTKISQLVRYMFYKYCTVNEALVSNGLKFQSEKVCLGSCPMICFKTETIRLGKFHSLGSIIPCFSIYRTVFSYIIFCYGEHLRIVSVDGS